MQGAIQGRFLTDLVSWRHPARILWHYVQPAIALVACLISDYWRSDLAHLQHQCVSESRVREGLIPHKNLMARTRVARNRRPGHSLSRGLAKVCPNGTALMSENCFRLLLQEASRHTKPAERPPSNITVVPPSGVPWGSPGPNSVHPESPY